MQGVVYPVRLFITGPMQQPRAWWPARRVPESRDYVSRRRAGRLRLGAGMNPRPLEPVAVSSGPGLTPACPGDTRSPRRPPPPPPARPAEVTSACHQPARVALPAQPAGATPTRLGEGRASRSLSRVTCGSLPAGCLRELQPHRLTHPQTAGSDGWRQPPLGILVPWGLRSLEFARPGVFTP